MTKNRVYPTVFLIICSAVVFIFIQYLLLSKSYGLEKKKFDFEARELVAESFYQIPFNDDGMEELSASLLNSLRQAEDLKITDKIMESIRSVFHQYKNMETIIQKKFAMSNIDMNLLSAVSVSKFTLRDKTLPEYNLIDADKNGIEPIIAGDLTDLSKSNLNSRFFKMGNNYYMQINSHVDYPELQSYFFYQMKELFILSAITTLTILTILIFILQTILKQKKLSAMKSDFINNITHELNTPISTIAVAAKNLKQKTVKNNATKLDSLAEVISRQNVRLQQIIENVMNISFMEKESLKLNKKKVNAHQLIAGVISDFQIQYEEKSLSVIKNYDAENDALCIDLYLFATAIFNLMDNSVKYNTNNPEIHVRTRSSGKHFILMIEDNGIGMKKEELKHIFNKFYRIAEGNPQGAKGLGIGLHTVRKIVEAHNGHITATSKPSQGSRFEIVLPIYRT